MVEPRPRARAIATIPNAVSFARILLIPVFMTLIVREGMEVAGLLVFAVVASTDWVDGYVARRTGRVTELGAVLDPVADRLAIAAVLVAVVIRDAFPLWAALLILVRDAVVLIAGLVALWMWGVRIDVRRIGKAATLLLMLAVPSVAWAGLELPAASAFAAVGWGAFGVGIAASYAAAAWYAVDLRRALAGRRRPHDRG